MAGRAVVVQVFEVVFMAEWNAAGVPGFNMDRLPEISGNDHRKDDYSSQQQEMKEPVHSEYLFVGWK